MAWTTSAFPRGIRVSDVVIGESRTAMRNALNLFFDCQSPRHTLAVGTFSLAVLGVSAPLLPDSLLPPLLLGLAATFAATLYVDQKNSQSSTSTRPCEATSKAKLRVVAQPMHDDTQAQTRHHLSTSTFSPNDCAKTYEPITYTQYATSLDQAQAANLMPRISHEIRTPLNAIIGFADLMTKEVFGPLGHPRYREYLNHIRDSGRDLLRSSEDTLAISQLLIDPVASNETIRSDLAQLAKEAWDSLSDGRETDVTLEMDVPNGIEVHGDRRSIRQSISNILIAARDSAEPGAAIHLTASPAPDRVRIEIKLAANAMRADAANDTLALAIARTLLDLQGTTLVHMAHTVLGWRATTWFDVAGQHEFFPAQTQRTPNAYSLPTDAASQLTACAA